MTSLLSAVRRRPAPPPPPAEAEVVGPEERGVATLEDYVQLLQLTGVHPLLGTQHTMKGEPAEKAPTDFTGFATIAATNGVLFACLLARMSVFSSVRFQWQQLNSGRPSTLFGTADLQALEEPWTGATTQDLLARVIQDADLAGNSYWTHLSGELVRMRPDWVDIVLAPRWMRGGQLGWEKAGYLYTEGGPGRGGEPVPFLADEVAHFAPHPDPLATYRGMSWMTPVAREVINDNLLSRHKQKYLENAATPNVIVTMPREINAEAFERFKARMDANHRGVENAWKTLYLGGGADVTIVGDSMQKMAFQSVQGAGETRIAAAAGVPPVIVGLSEGLQAATYSNYSQARRRFADGTIHPLWQNAAGTFQRIVRPPGTGAPGSVRLWYDARHVPFLREDTKDAATILRMRASTIRQLTDAGFTPDSAIRAVEAEDLSLLEHSGLYSVQLQKPGETAPALPSPTQGGT